MAERPYARYTREKTWQALYSQAINACYALVPNSATNNSIWLLRCKTPAETQERMRFLLSVEQECAAFFAEKQLGQEQKNLAADTPLTQAGNISGVLEAAVEGDRPTQEQIKLQALLANAGEAVVLAKSSDYWHYHLEDGRPTLALVACGLHDSYLHLPVWEMRSNRRFAVRETALKIGSPEFERKRGRGHVLGHSILVSALAAGDSIALEYVKNKEKVPDRTRRFLCQEAATLQGERYRGRPLAFYTEAKRQEIGQKISAGLILYHARRAG